MRASNHLVHFFDDLRARVTTVSTYVAEALRRNRSVLVVARRAHWRRVAARLKRQATVAGPVDRKGRLVVLDADAVLSSLMRRGRLDKDLFRRTISPLVWKLAAVTPEGVAAYGEMVDILAAERNLPAVERLEESWNELMATAPLTLLCGYDSARFTTPSTQQAVGVICRAHHSVRTDAPDGLGRWLVEGATTSSSAAPAEL